MDDEDGWVGLGAVGKRLANLASDFDPRTYGVAKLSDLVRKTGAFEIDQPEGRGTVRIRLKPAPKAQAKRTWLIVDGGRPGRCERVSEAPGQHLHRLPGGPVGDSPQQGRSVAGIVGEFRKLRQPEHAAQQLDALAVENAAGQGS